MTRLSSAFGLAIVLASPLTLQAAKASTIATVLEVRGEGFRTPPGGREVSLMRGDALVGGTKLRTTAGGSAKIRFTDGSEVNLRPQTSMRLSGMKRARKTNTIVLFFGRLWNKVSRGDRRHYEVRTANAVCGVRGTEFETGVADDGSLRVRVHEGSVGVGVQSGAEEIAVNGGNAVDADESGVGESYTAEEQEKWELWQKRKRQRLQKRGRSLIGSLKGQIRAHQAKINQLRQEQEQLLGQRREAEGRGDISAVKRINRQLSQLGEQIADLADQADSQFGLADHYADLANDRRFRMIGRKYLIREAATLRRLRTQFDQMVAEGTDISMESMDRLLEDMHQGKDSLDHEKGSTVKDLFGPQDKEFDF